MAATPIAIATTIIAITNIDAGAGRLGSRHPEPPVHIRRTLLANPGGFTHNSRFSGCGGNFMRVVRSRGLALGWMFATALCCSLLPTAGQAYTPEQQQACS